MTAEQAYEWLAPKLSLSEREALNVIYNEFQCIKIECGQKEFLSSWIEQAAQWYSEFLKDPKISSPYITTIQKVQEQYNLTLTESRKIVDELISTRLI